MKYFSRPDVGPLRDVAPCAGAWVEIHNPDVEFCDKRVAPCAGAWVEIFW